MPTKMSPNAVFDGATAKIRTNEEVKRRFGENFKTNGMDHGGHREGHRNFVKNTECIDVDTNRSKRTRVRFNLEGQYGMAFVFAEVSDLMPLGDLCTSWYRTRGTARSSAWWRIGACSWQGSWQGGATRGGTSLLGCWVPVGEAEEGGLDGANDE